MMDPIQERIRCARQILFDAEFILIGAGAGLSAAAGLTYSASFYPFETQEESWAQWARHIDGHRFSQGPTPLYQMLLQLVPDREYFVITTNVESQFEKTGFPKEKIFEVQGNYAYLQCAKGCHDKL